MAKLRDRLPPPNSLVVFEAAARHLSFTRAALELRVTQAAVSRQIRILEDHLGTALFERGHRALELTPDGKRLHDAVVMGLEHIANASAEIRRGDDRSAITIASSVTFAAYWLMARVAQFRAIHPEIDLRLVATARSRDLANSQLDLTIRYGRGGWPEVVAHPMFNNDILPVCAPSYLARHGPIRQPADLRSQVLLHLAEFDRNWVTWETWLRSFGVAPPAQQTGLFFDHYMVLLQAALSGHGIALCGGRLAEDFLTRGDLVRPIDAALRSDHSFYLLHRADRPLRAQAVRFRDWLLQAARRPTAVATLRADSLPASQKSSQSG
jgi:LysR family glycine cleavage system transcriptional activator